MSTATPRPPRSGPGSGFLGATDGVLVKVALWLRILAGVVIVLMMATTVYDVVMRAVFKSPTDWALTLNAAGILAATFLAVPHLTATNSHIDMDLFTRMLGTRTQRSVGILVTLINLAFGALLAWLGYRATYSAYLNGLYTSGNFALPIWTLYAMIWIGGVGMVLVILLAPWRRQDSPDLAETSELDLHAGVM